MKSFSSVSEAREILDPSSNSQMIEVQRLYEALEREIQARSSYVLSYQELLTLLTLSIKTNLTCGESHLEIDLPMFIKYLRMIKVTPQIVE